MTALEIFLAVDVTLHVFLAIIWKKNTLTNALLKTALTILTGAGTVLLLQQLQVLR